MNIYIFGGVAGAGFCGSCCAGNQEIGLFGRLYEGTELAHSAFWRAGHSRGRVVFFSVLKEEGAFVKLVGG